MNVEGERKILSNRESLKMLKHGDKGVQRRRTKQRAERKQKMRAKQGTLRCKWIIKDNKGQGKGGKRRWKGNKT